MRRHEEEIDGTLRLCRRSQYHALADVIEYFTEREGETSLSPMGAPDHDRVDQWHVMWAFRAGYAFERGKTND